MHREQQGSVSHIPLPQLHLGILPAPHRRGTAERIPLPPPEHFCPVFKELWEEEGAGGRQSSATTHSRLGRTQRPSRGLFICLSEGTALPVMIQDTCHLLIQNLPGIR